MAVTGRFSTLSPNHKLKMGKSMTSKNDTTVNGNTKRRNPISIGDVFHRLSVIDESEKSSSGDIQFTCQCECGNIKVFRSSHLYHGKVKSCGCLQKETRGKSTITHGMSKTPEYKIWKGIKRRCYNKNEQFYYRYGGAGIVLSDEFKDDFKAFYDYIGERPSATHSIDRINNSKGYERENMRWATSFQQSQNRLPFKNSPFGIKGVTKEKKNGTFRASITFSGKRKHLGYFVNFFDACCARKSAENKLWA